MIDKPNILIADDSRIFCEGMAVLLKQYPEKTGSILTAQDYNQVMDVLENNAVDVLLLDLNFKNNAFNGLTIAEFVKKNYLKVSVIILTQQAQVHHYKKLFDDLNVSGYLDKKIGVVDILRAIEEVSKGNRFIGNEIERMLQISRFMQFSKREKEVLHALAKGLTQKQIAEQLFISDRTVETHIRTMTQRVGCKNSTHLVALFSKSYI